MLGALQQPDAVALGKALGGIVCKRVDQHELARRQAARDPSPRQCEAHFAGPDKNHGTNVT